MSFQPSSLRVAGQDSGIVNALFPSPETSRCLLDVGLSPTPGKQMYGNNESVKSWIDAIDRDNTAAFRLDDSDDADVSQFATHPFRTCRSRSPFPDDLGSEREASFCLDSLAWAPDVLASSYYDDSDETHSDSSLSDDAQYITIPPDRARYRPPSPSPGPVSTHELTTAVYANSCSSDVRQAIAQQDLLLAIFYQELRRVVPRNNDTEYDPDWLEDVDADLVLAPLETYADICWESAVYEKSPSKQLDRPVPDVPTGFDQIYGAY